MLSGHYFVISTVILTKIMLLFIKRCKKFISVYCKRGIEMGYNKLLDMHTHTDNSPDGSAAIMYMCEVAQQKGLRAIAFTDHCEVDDYKQNKNAPKRIKQSYFESVKARSVYMGRLIVSSGVELGQPTYDTKTAEEIISKYKFDIVLAAIHNLRDGEDFYFMDFSTQNIDEIMTQYFKEILGVAKWDKFDSLVHLTYPIRYITGKYGLDVDLKKYSDYTDEILKVLAQNGKALEINTSGLRGALKDTMPTKDIIKRFKELGGERITIGSDAHKAKDIGCGVEQAMGIAVDCGFNFITLYQNRVPIMIPIE